MKELKGDLNTAFYVDSKYLFVEGWLVAPDTQIKSVELLDSQGQSVSVSFRFEKFDRKDVVEAVGNNMNDGYAAYGYRFLLFYPRSSAKPYALRVTVSDEWTHVMFFGATLTNEINNLAKVGRLRDIYGEELNGKNVPEVQPSIARTCLDEFESSEGLFREFPLSFDAWHLFQDGTFFCYAGSVTKRF